MTREQREVIRKQIDALMRERLGGERSPRSSSPGQRAEEATEGEVAPVGACRRLSSARASARLRHERGEWRVLALDGERGINRRI